MRTVCKILLVFLLFQRINGCSPSNDSKTRTDETTGIEEGPGFRDWLTQRDSILADNGYGSVYLTRDTLFERYDWLLPAAIVSDFNASIDAHRRLAVKLADTVDTEIRNFRLGNLIRAWTELYVVDDRYYVYSPSDWMSNIPMYITDSAIYSVASDLWFPELITGFRKRSDKHYELQLSGIEGRSVLSIRIVDSQHGVAVWEYRDSGGELLKRKLYVDSRNVRRFPMVICDCPLEKCGYDYDFDEPDFDSLLRNSR